jgi:hypothetical protein
VIAAVKLVADGVPELHCTSTNVMCAFESVTEYRAVLPGRVAE